MISATMANLFAVIDGALVTPALDRCGVAGVARAEILAMGGTQVRDLPLDLFDLDCEHVDLMFPLLFTPLPASLRQP